MNTKEALIKPCADYVAGSHNAVRQRATNPALLKVVEMKLSEDSILGQVCYAGLITNKLPNYIFRMKGELNNTFFFK